MLKSGFINLLLTFAALSSQGNAQGNESTYQEGEAYAQESIQSLEDASKNPDLDAIPQGQNAASFPPVARHELDGDITQAIQDNDGAKFVEKSFSVRPVVHIDEKNDPLIVQGNAIVENPFKHIDPKIMVVSGLPQGNQYQRYRCSAIHDVSKYTCHQTLSVHVQVRPEERRETWRCTGYTVKKSRSLFRKVIDWNSHSIKKHRTHKSRSECQSAGKGCYQLDVQITPKAVTTNDIWHDGCANLESQADTGFCAYVSKRCAQPGGTRILSGESIHRPCWAWEYTYACGEKVDQGCKALLKRGCHQIDSVCTREEGGLCTAWENTFECLEQGGQPGPTYMSGDIPYCLDGNCAEQGTADNKEMAESLSKLSILAHMEQDIKAGLTEMFVGEAKTCSKDWTSFRDCCSRLSGWGVSLHLSSCSQGEQELAHNREKGLTVQVGTYCALRILGQCITKKTTFCQFRSKIARLIQEQGRAQIGRSWGTPQKPDCGGLSIDELTSIDFSQIDLSEMFDDLLKNQREPDKQGMLDRISSRMESLQSGMEDAYQNYKQTKRGKCSRCKLQEIKR